MCVLAPCVWKLFTEMNANVLTIDHIKWMGPIWMCRLELNLIVWSDPFVVRGRTIQCLTTSIPFPNTVLLYVDLWPPGVWGSWWSLRDVPRWILRRDGSVYLFRCVLDLVAEEKNLPAAGLGGGGMEEQNLVFVDVVIFVTSCSCTFIIDYELVVILCHWPGVGGGIALLYSL